jgi:DNA-binding MltR family transcriptional regulator
MGAAVAKTPAYLTKFRSVSRGEVTLADLDALEKELFGENDRASILLMGSLVDACLERLLRTPMRSNLSQSDANDLFDGNGPLSTFSAKIALAYALGLIGPTCRRELNLIRELRNAFAHSLKRLDFAVSEVGAICEQLQVPDLPGAVIPFQYIEMSARGGKRKTSQRCSAPPDSLYIGLPQHCDAHAGVQGR